MKGARITRDNGLKKISAGCEALRKILVGLMLPFLEKVTKRLKCQTLKARAKCAARTARARPAKL